jgi:hypothetical protein
MVSASSLLLIVFKRTGGRAWLKPWGFTGHTQTQKATRRKQNRRFVANRDALRQATEAHWESLAASGSLPSWGESRETVRQRKLDARRKWYLWQATQARYFPLLETLHASIERESKR